MTATEQGDVTVWSVETGEKMVAYSNAHGKGVSITSMAFDSTRKRLITGASDGSVKVWNFNIGHSLRKLVDVCHQEVGIVFRCERGNVHSIIGTGYL